MHFLIAAAALAALQPAQPTPFAGKGPLALRAATPNATVVPVYRKLELKLDLTATYDNPFDPDDVDVYAVFVSPNGATRRVNAFFYQPFKRSLDGDAERIEPAGDAVWLVRFTPDRPGRWTYAVHARDRSGEVALPGGKFTATRGAQSTGFIGRSSTNARYFQYASGKPFFAIGENMCWGGKRGSYDYDKWLPDLAKVGGNWIRIWMCSWNCALEWAAQSQGDWRSGKYYGVGVYSLDNAWKLDTILDAAEANGIHTMLCFGTYGEFNEGGYFNEGQWKVNPYNKANGGPCDKPADFWTSPQARKLYRQRLRYIAARYGYRTGIHSWEFWNEAVAPAAWVAEMARYTKGTGEFAGHGADPFGHLLTTTYGNDAVWKIPELDFTQTHHYGTGNVPDHAPVVHNDAVDHERYGKPHLMGEFGLDWRSGDEKYDPQGKAINLHNALWAGALSGDAGTAMIWWWDGYVAPKNLYGTWSGISRFAADVPWSTVAWKRAEFTAPTSGKADTFTDLLVPSASGWGRASKTDYTLTPFGVEGGANLPQYLYSPAKADLRTAPAFHVKFERPGRFILHVDAVSGSGRVVARMDGKTVMDVALSAEPPKDPAVKPAYESTELKKEYNVFQARFNRDYGFDVPAGEHTITLDNAEGDWVSVESYRLTGYRSSRYPDMHLYGLASPRLALLWAHNAADNWKNVADGKAIEPLREVRTVLKGLPDGRYRVEWWDTVKGTVTATEVLTSKAGALPLRFPDIATDVAAKVVKE